MVAMVFSDFLDHYRAMADDELINLATQAAQLSPDAREALKTELSSRRINSEQVSVRQQDQKRALIEERTTRVRSLGLLSPGLNRIRKRFADWREYRQRTSQWPWKSIVFYFSHLLLEWIVLIFLLWYALQHGWSKWSFVLIVAALLGVDVFVSTSIERKIRLSEIQDYRAHATVP